MKEYTNETKKALINELAERLNSLGFGDMDLFGQKMSFTYGEGTMHQFEFMPEENIARLVELSKKDYKNYGDFYQEAGDSGIFKFKPYIVGGEKCVTLVLRHNRYMDLFRGRTWQISDTFEGVGAFANCYYSIGKLLHSGMYGMDTYIANSDLWQMLIYTSYLNCGFQCQNFLGTFNENKDLLDEFYRMCLKNEGIETDFCFKKFSNYIAVSPDTIPVEVESKVFEINGKNGTPFCYFNIDEDKIYVATKDKGGRYEMLTTLSIPEVSVGTQTVIGTLPGEQEDYLDMFDECYRDKQDIKRQLLLGLLSLCGIHMFSHGAYPLKKLDPLRRYNRPNIAVFDKLDDLY